MMRGKTFSLFLFKFFIIFPLFLEFKNKAWGWDEHRTLMPIILKSAPFLDQQILGQSSPTPCETEDRKTYSDLVLQLQLNSFSKLPRTSIDHCGLENRISYMSILTGGVVDDPDHGMDQNLPAVSGNSFDPDDDRKWMGGYEGPTSQGFRHMYFGGWQFSHPMTTFQFPLYSIGKGPERVSLLAKKAKELLKSGHKAWGVRVLGWAMHYVQDLCQPFHSVQIVNLKLVPWNELFNWPPTVAFQKFVDQTTRIVTNLHWAYEGYTLNRVKKGDLSPFAPCLSQPEKYTQFVFDPKNQDPIELAFEVVEKSISIAGSLGSSEQRFFGGRILQNDIDLVKTPNLLDYEDYATRPDLRVVRDELHAVTCKALANTSMATRLLLEWAFYP